MKRLRGVSVLLFVLLALGGCAPTLNLNHNHLEGYKYEQKGKIRVLPFVDNRPAKEKKQKTDPPVDLFIRNTVIEEIERANLFEVTDSESAEFELSGSINSFKYTQKPNAVFIAGDALIGLASIGPLYGMAPGGVILVDLVGLGVALAGKFTLSTSLNYDVVLKKSGKVVWGGNSNKWNKDVEWAAALMRQKDVFRKYSSSLDQLLTLSIREMLKEVQGLEAGRAAPSVAGAAKTPLPITAAELRDLSFTRNATSPKSRKGFVLGIGLGPGFTTSTAKYSWGYKSDRVTRKALSSALKIGYAPSDRLLVFWMSNVAWMHIGESAEDSSSTSITYIHGLGSLGVSYYLNKRLFLTGGIGASTWDWPFEEDVPNAYRGLGLALGGGYEISPHWVLGGDLVWGKPGNDEIKINAFSIGVTFGRLWY